ncbi:MAG: hypothetical protein HY290_19585, partial [Planctomycetia bacterium]|nr:hypothetical protein [Planctomycetia bacterium]
QQGTAFFVRAPNGATVAVTASHYLDQNGPALNHVRLLSVTAAEPTALTDSAICWGLPGGEGVRGENDVTDLRADRFLLPVSVDERFVHVLDLDDRPGPQPGEMVWFPDKQPGEPGGFRLLAGTVIQVETRFVCVELDTALKLQSQSGSPVISRINGKVLGLLGGGTEESGTTILFLNPAAEIRKALEDSSRPGLSTVVGKPPKRENPPPPDQEPPERLR